MIELELRVVAADSDPAWLEDGRHVAGPIVDRLEPESSIQPEPDSDAFRTDVGDTNPHLLPPARALIAASGRERVVSPAIDRPARHLLLDYDHAVPAIDTHYVQQGRALIAEEDVHALPPGRRPAGRRYEVLHQQTERDCHVLEVFSVGYRPEDRRIVRTQRPRPGRAPVRHTGPAGLVTGEERPTRHDPNWRPNRLRIARVEVRKLICDQAVWLVEVIGKHRMTLHQNRHTGGGCRHPPPRRASTSR